MILTHCQNNLNEINRLISQLTPQQYQKPSELLSNSTIGQHVRHILEFYTSLYDGLDCLMVNYDKRNRNLQLETNPKFAIKTIESIIVFLNFQNNDISLQLESNFSSEEEKPLLISTSFYRELAYCLEHSIHHQALIKVSLLNQELYDLIDANFGLAPATIRHKKQLITQS